MKELLILSLIVLTLWVPASQFTAAQNGGWRVESATPLSDIVEERPDYTFPSPDGRQLAYERAGDSDSRTNLVCTLDIHTRDERCTDLPRPINLRPNDYFPPGSWSPDSTQYALVGLPLHRFYDTDLSIADFTNPTLVTVSDDGFEGSFFPYQDAPGTTIEIQPAWSPDGRLIAVERTLITGNGIAPSTITLFDLETGEVRDLV